MGRYGRTTVGSQFGLCALGTRCPSMPGATRGVSSIAARTVAPSLTMRALGNEPTVPIGLPSTCVTSTIRNRSRGSRSKCLMARQRGRCLVNTSSQIYFVHLQLRARRPLATRSHREEVAVPYNLLIIPARALCKPVVKPQAVGGDRQIVVHGLPFARHQVLKVHSKDVPGGCVIGFR